MHHASNTRRSRWRELADHRCEGRVTEAEASPERATPSTSPCESIRTGSAPDPDGGQLRSQDPAGTAAAPPTPGRRVQRLQCVYYSTASGTFLQQPQSAIEYFITRSRKKDKQETKRVCLGCAAEARSRSNYLLSTSTAIIGTSGTRENCRISLLRGEINSSFRQKLQPQGLRVKLMLLTQRYLSIRQAVFFFLLHMAINRHRHSFSLVLLNLPQDITQHGRNAIRTQDPEILVTASRTHTAP